jgi:catechol 2,3-dioxygenase-like lactoylglutathione lyase family enzyme
VPVVPRANRLEAGMPHLRLTALLVHDYDEAIAWFTAKLGFRLIEDRPVTPSKRWVIVAPPGHSPTRWPPAPRPCRYP